MGAKISRNRFPKRGLCKTRYRPRVPIPNQVCCARARGVQAIGRISPVTTDGIYRDGCCNTGQEDIGSHTVCVVMTSAFLGFSKSRGNDLSTPVPEFGFPGLKPGDRWCLCAARWQEALQANQAPRVVLRATHESAFSYCSLADLRRLAVDLA